MNSRAQGVAKYHICGQRVATAQSPLGRVNSGARQVNSRAQGVNSHSPHLDLGEHLVAVRHLRRHVLRRVQQVAAVVAARQRRRLRRGSQSVSQSVSRQSVSVSSYGRKLLKLFSHTVQLYLHTD